MVPWIMLHFLLLLFAHNYWVGYSFLFTSLSVVAVLISSILLSTLRLFSPMWLIAICKQKVDPAALPMCTIRINLVAGRYISIYLRREKNWVSYVMERRKTFGAPLTKPCTHSQILIADVRSGINNNFTYMIFSLFFCFIYIDVYLYKSQSR